MAQLARCVLSWTPDAAPLERVLAVGVLHEAVGPGLDQSVTRGLRGDDAELRLSRGELAEGWTIHSSWSR